MCVEKREKAVRLGDGARGRARSKAGKEPRTQACLDHHSLVGQCRV